MREFPFPRAFRIQKSEDFRKVYDEGNSVKSDKFAVFFLNKEDISQPARLGITVTRRFGKSVQRNRAKRLVREAFRHLHPQLEKGMDIVVNVRSGVRDTSFSIVKKDLERLFLRAGLLES